MIRGEITDQWAALSRDPATFQRFILDTYGADSFALAPFPYVALHTADGQLIGYATTYGLPRITIEGEHVILEMSDLIIPLPDRTALREALAAHAHDGPWSGWMKYMMGIGTLNDDGTWTMPAWAVERWTRQMTTAYAELPEAERASDRIEADRIFAVLDRELL